MNKCMDCGKPIKKHFVRCFECDLKHKEQINRHMETMIGSYFEDEPDSSPMCVMCGREWGTYLQKDGKYYCSMCWAVWNS